MDEIQNFYLRVLAELKNLQAIKLNRSRLLPQEYVIFSDKGESFKQKRLAKKAEKQRKQIEEGYYKGIADCIGMVNHIYKVTLKCYLKD